ncbi:hypothetical protein LSAT2_006554 [Lamellibrachia satsuma]|nr:hypothetical protein LSAT2_006554 [Lamellibrachia satsuma]
MRVLRVYRAIPRYEAAVSIMVEIGDRYGQIEALVGMAKSMLAAKQINKTTSKSRHDFHEAAARDQQGTGKDRQGTGKGGDRPIITGVNYGYGIGEVRSSVPAVRSCVPVVRSCEPAVRSCVPAVRSCVPVVRSSVPAVRSFVPVVRSCVPAVRSSVPAVRSCVPVVRSSVPAVRSCVPVVRSCVPVVRSCALDYNAKALDLATNIGNKMHMLRCRILLTDIYRLLGDTRMVAEEQCRCRRLQEDMQLICRACTKCLGESPNHLEFLPCCHLVHNRCAYEATRRGSSKNNRSSKFISCPTCSKDVPKDSVYL